MHHQQTNSSSSGPPNIPPQSQSQSSNSYPPPQLKYPHHYSSPMNTNNSPHKNGANHNIYAPSPSQQLNPFALHSGSPAGHSNLPRIDLGPGSMAVEHVQIQSRPPDKPPMSRHPPNYWPSRPGPQPASNSIPRHPIQQPSSNSIPRHPIQQPYRTPEGEMSADEINRRIAEDQVRKHFEESFKFAQLKDHPGKNALLPQKGRGSMGLPPDSYLPPAQGYSIHSPQRSSTLSNLPPDLNSGPRPQQPLAFPKTYASPHQTPPPLVNNTAAPQSSRTIKVSSPAPAQFYGKPAITVKPENNGSSPGRDSPMELTSRAHSTPPRPQNTNVFGKVSFPVQNDGPYDLSRPSNPEVQSEPLFLKREATDICTGLDKRPKVELTANVNFDESMDLSYTSRTSEPRPSEMECIDMTTNSKETVPVFEIKPIENNYLNSTSNTSISKSVLPEPPIPIIDTAKEEKEEADSDITMPQSNLPIHKGKKAWLERHDQEGINDVPSPNHPSTNPAPEESLNGNNRLRRRKKRPELDSIKENADLVLEGSNSSTESENGEKDNKKRRAQRRKQNQSPSIAGSNSTANNSDESDVLQHPNASPSKGSPAKRAPKSNNRKREKKTSESSLPASTRKSNPFNRPTIVSLKKTNESFLQDASCLEIAPKLMKCRECKAHHAANVKRDDDGINHIFCRFYGFRKLKFMKSGVIRADGFSDAMKDPKQEDLNLWLPNPKVLPKNLDSKLANFIIEQLGDQFCELVQQEQGALEIYKQAEVKSSSDCTDESSEIPVAWKRVVQGVREMCDVCDTTLFNYHWACEKCGFVVCIDCVKSKVNKKEITKATPEVKEHGPRSDRDPFNWLYCLNCKQTRQSHEIDKLMLTQTIPRNALVILGKFMHYIRTKYNMPQTCKCEFNMEDFVKSDEFMYLINQKESLNSANSVEEAVTDLTKFSESNTNNLLKKETEKLNPEVVTEGNYTTLDVKVESIASNGTHLPTQVENNSNNDVSTSRLGLKSDEAGASCDPKQDSESEDDDELHNLFQQEKPIFSQSPKVEKPAPLPSKTIVEVPHTYLCSGRLLHLFDPQAEGNFQLFAKAWKHGHPVLVSNVAATLDPQLWSPQSFLDDFGVYKNDLVNCLTGKIVANQPMSKFWKGFFKIADRLKDADGKPMLLKLKDWPPGEDFAESLPSRFLDLMDHLPLPEYTRRDGRLNLASLLPDKFVKPDLGPKMYIAYGSAFHLDKATTNLHLDISDAVNVMVYVGMCDDITAEDKEQHEKALSEALEHSDCDGFTLERLKESDRQPGALWHIYNAKDADKIRDFLNRINVEKGKAPAPNHDPIHDQVWYLDRELRRRLIDEYDVIGYPIIQFMGDAVFIPAGAPHQVRNLQNCIKVAEDFVSPEHVPHCFTLTQEFRGLSDTHSNHEDKLQIKNIIFHAVKDAVTVLNLNLKN